MMRQSIMEIAGQFLKFSDEKLEELSKKNQSLKIEENKGKKR